MKYIITLFSALVLFSSCLKDTTSTMKYILEANFDRYSDITFREDSTFFSTNKRGGYAWKDLMFLHKVSSDDKTHLGGFALSNMRPRLSTTTDSPANLYRQYGVKNSPNVYSVFRIDEDPSNMPEQHIVFVNKIYGTCNPLGCFVANSEKVVEEVKEKFEKGDSLTLVITGYKDKTKTASAKLNLAKYSAQKDSIISKWTPFKFEKLGEVDCVKFDILSTKPGISRAFCMDDFTASIFISY